jgi:hypothetical protein
MQKKVSKKSVKEPRLGHRIAKSLDEAIAWARGENVPVRVTTVQVPPGRRGINTHI